MEKNIGVASSVAGGERGDDPADNDVTGKFFLVHLGSLAMIAERTAAYCSAELNG